MAELARVQGAERATERAVAYSDQNVRACSRPRRRPSSAILHRTPGFGPSTRRRRGRNRGVLIGTVRDARRRQRRNRSNPEDNKTATSPFPYLDSAVLLRRCSGFGGDPEAHVSPQHQPRLRIQRRNGAEHDEVDREQKPLDRNPEPVVLSITGRTGRHEHN